MAIKKGCRKNPAASKKKPQAGQPAVYEIFFYNWQSVVNE